MILFSKTLVAGFATAGVLVAGSLEVQADVIPISSTSSAQQGRINSSFSQPGGISEGRTIRAGTTGGNAEFRGYMIFDTASYLPTVTGATLTYELATPAGSPGNYNVYGVSTDAGFNAFVDNAAERENLFNAPGTTNATLLGTYSPAAGVVNVDATAFVAAERAGGNNVVAFVFAEAAPSLDSTLDLIQFYDGNDPGVQNPQLTLVPEPSSLALLGLGGLLIARRRRG